MTTTAYGTSPINRSRASREDVQARREAVAEIVAADAPTSVRHAYYRAVVAKLVPKTQAGYRQVQNDLVLLRRAGKVPYGEIVDNARSVYRSTSWDSVTDALEHTARLYRRNLWSQTERRLEVWCESDSVAGVLRQTTGAWTVDLFPTRGFSSMSFAWNAAQQANSDGRPVDVLYIGDHDPAGLEIETALHRELLAHSEVTIVWRRLAVTWPQVEEMDLPGTEPKKPYGHPMAVEAEAIPAHTMRDLLEAEIASRVDPVQLAILEQVEAEERRGLRDLADWKVA